MSPDEKQTHERQRIAYETLVSPRFDIGVFAGIARVVAQGLNCRGAGVARLVDGQTQLETIGLWLADTVHPLFKFPLRGSPCEVTVERREAITVIERDLAASYQLASVFGEVALESYYGVVLHNDSGAAIGILYAVDDQPRRPNPDD